MREQRFVDGQIGQIGFHRGAFLRIQRLSRLERIQRGRRVGGVVGERIWWQAWWKVVAHDTTLRSAAGIAPGNVTASR
jgi:hypothetical protein